MNQTATVVLGALALALLGWFLFSGGMEDATLPEASEAPPVVETPPELRSLEPRPEAPGPSLEGAPADAPTPETPPPAEPAVRKAPAHSGIFTLRYREGYSFLDRTVGKEGARDLVLTGLAGGVSSATLEAPAGRIASARSLRGELKDAKTAFGLLGALLRGHPAALPKGQRAQGDSHAVATNVFLAQTRRGEWVKLAIVHRDKTGRGWQQYGVSIAYTLNPDEPVFGTGTGDLVKAGFEFSTAAITTAEHAIVAAKQKAVDEKERPYRDRITALDARALDLQRGLTAAGHKVAAVMARGHATKLGSANAYVAASFSFEHDTRDDAKATRNDWDFVYSSHGGHDWLRVRTVTDDRGFAWDLGVIDFEQALRGDVTPTEGLAQVKLLADHLYLIHTLDRETDHWVLMKVLEAVPGEAFLFEWVLVEDPAALRRVLESSDDDLQEPYARLQVQSDHGGGNPHRAFLDGSHNAYVDDLSTDLLDLSTSSKESRRSVAHVVGGLVPEGKQFRIQSVEYTLHFDHPDRVDSELRIGAFKILDAETSSQQGAITLFTADGGLRTVTAKDLPLRGSIKVDIAIRRDQEKTVFLEGASFTRNDVILRGRFEDVRGEAPQHAGWSDSAYRSAHLALFRVLRMEAAELDARMFAPERYPGAVAWFERVRAHATEASFQRKVDALLALLRK